MTGVYSFEVLLVPTGKINASESSETGASVNLFRISPLPEETIIFDSEGVPFTAFIAPPSVILKFVKSKWPLDKLSVFVTSTLDPRSKPAALLSSNP